MHRTRIKFEGRVQGVGFRATARSVAEGFPLSGWVRNEPDGTVLAEIQGEQAAIDAYLLALRRRMAGFIRRDSSESIPTLPGESGFEITR